jgi:hypothetical protein
MGNHEGEFALNKRIRKSVKGNNIASKKQLRFLTITLT